VVALAIPAKRERATTLDGVGLWLASRDGESRRVLYVGASRAERLAILLTDESQYGDVIACLERDGVPRQRWTVR
jgi:hypothetical protein